MLQPRYRSDAKGNIRKLMDEFKAMVINEIKTGDHFLVDVADSWAYDEYAQYLTHAELDRAFKAACKA